MSCDFIALAQSGVRGLHPYQAGKPIEELQREFGLSHIVKLASNENPLGPSEKVLQACQRAAADIVRYPDSNGFELKQALSHYLSIDAAQITLGNGSNDVLDLVARAFLGPDASAVYSQHAFIVYPIAVQACGAAAKVTAAKDWGHDLTAMLGAIDASTKVVFIANPNNPTGTWLKKAELCEFLDQVPEQVIVVLDEAYGEYINEPDYPDGVELLKKYANLIVTRTFSKAFGLAALRVGYSVSNPQIADLLNRVRAPFNVNSLGLAAACAVLDDNAYLEKSRSVNTAGYAQLTQGFDELGLRYIPSIANFISVEMPKDTAQVYQQLLQLGVIVRPIGVYEMTQHLRISIGLEAENKACLDALKKVIS